MAECILVVDDDTLLRRSLAYNLEQAGYRTATAADAESALMLVSSEPIDLVLLDIGLPGMDGLDAVRLFRKQTDIPIIFLTARRRELDDVIRREVEAEDVVTKPFDLTMLLARIKAALKTDQESQKTPKPKLKSNGPMIQLGDLTIDPASYSVRVGQKQVDLAPREFDLLRVLAVNAGRTCSIDDLLSQVWGQEYEGEPQVVYVHIRWLREKLEEDPANPRRIRTVYGRGYLLADRQ